MGVATTSTLSRALPTIATSSATTAATRRLQVTTSHLHTSTSPTNKKMADVQHGNKAGVTEEAVSEWFCVVVALFCCYALC